MTQDVAAYVVPRDAGGWGDSVGELTDEMLHYLVSIVRSKPTGRALSTGVAAAGKVLDHCRWERERDGVDEMRHALGSDEAALAWLEAQREKFQARIAARQPAQLEAKESKDERVEESEGRSQARVGEAADAGDEGYGTL